MLAKARMENFEAGKRGWSIQAMEANMDWKKNKSLPHHMVIGTRALLALKWLVWR